MDEKNGIVMDIYWCVVGLCWVCDHGEWWGRWIPSWQYEESM